MDNSKKYITAEQAISLLPDGDAIHTFYDYGICLIGADWDREDVISRIKESDKIEITGYSARKMGHGIAVYNDDTKWQSEVLFIETDKTKLDELDPQVDYTHELHKDYTLNT